MEKYDNIVKSSEIRKLVENKMYQQALSILETIDINRVKVLTDLSVYADVYMHVGQFDEAKELLERIHAKSNSRRVIQQLIRLAIHRRDEEEAEEYYEEYLDVAPRDSDRYILRYRIDRMKGAEVEVLIDSLEQLKAYDYVEKWSYELAKLYHRAGMEEKCIRECSDIILWFGDGVIVEKAKMLKAIYTGEKPEHEEKSMDTSAKMEKTLENDHDFQYNHKSIQDIPIEGDYSDDYKQIYEDESLQNIFGSLLKIEGMKESIADYLCRVKEENKAFSMSVGCNNHTLSVLFAKAMAKALQELGVCECSHLAMISAERLNEIPLADQYDRLRKSFLVIEGASSLTEEKTEEILTMLSELDGQMVIILIDEEEKIEVLSHIFSYNMKLICSSKEDLVELAMDLFKQEELEVEEDALVSLETACNQIAVNVIEKDRVNSLTKLIETVISHAESRCMQEVMLSKGVINYEDSQLNKITAEDF